MPFDGSGLFSSITPYNPVLTNTLVSSTAFNATMSDLAQALSNCVTRDGQGGYTGPLQLGNNPIQGLSNGSAAAPAISWSGNDGFARPMAGNLIVSIAGVQVGRWDAGGYIGAIGTDEPHSGLFTDLKATSTFVLASANAKVQAVRDLLTSGVVGIDIITAAGLGWSIYSPPSSYNLQFYTTSGNTAIVLDYATGNVSLLKNVAIVGAVTLGNTASVAGTMTVNAPLIVGASTGGFSQPIQLQCSAGTKTMRLNPNGDFEFLSTGGGVIMTLANNGDLFVTGNLNVAGTINKA